MGREDLIERAAEIVLRDAGSVSREAPTRIEGRAEGPDGAPREQGEKPDLAARAVNLDCALDGRQRGDHRGQDASPASCGSARRGASTTTRSGGYFPSAASSIATKTASEVAPELPETIGSASTTSASPSPAGSSSPHHAPPIRAASRANLRRVGGRRAHGSTPATI